MSKIKDWSTTEKITLLEGWARDGLTNEQIAHNIGISVKTLYEWKNKKSDICDALKKGREISDYEVENALFRKAIGYSIEVTEEKLDRDGCVHELRKTIHVPPDSTAAIFWLKNRKPTQWRDKQEVETKISNIDNITPLIEMLEADKDE